MIEYKDFCGKVKDVHTSKRIITGYLSGFGNIDLHNDIIEKGAFTKTVQERFDKLFFLNQHDWKKPLSKFAVLREEEQGLYFETQPLPDTSYGNDVIALYDAGVLKEHSIGYEVIKYEDRKDGVRMLKELKLYEGSVVTIGANSETPFTGFKSLIEIDQETKRILKAYRSGEFTDETYVLLELALKNLQKHSYEMCKYSLTEPQESTQSKSISTYVDTINSYIKNT